MPWERTDLVFLCSSFRVTIVLSFIHLPGRGYFYVFWDCGDPWVPATSTDENTQNRMKNKLTQNRKALLPHYRWNTELCWAQYQWQFIKTTDNSVTDNWQSLWLNQYERSHFAVMWQEKLNRKGLYFKRLKKLYLIFWPNYD